MDIVPSAGHEELLKQKQNKKMKRFNVVLVRPPHPKFTHLNAYSDVMESLIFALREIGFDCTSSENTLNPTRTNIIFGWETAFRYREDFAQNGTVETIFPADTILFCLEQYAGIDIPEGHRLWRAAKTYQIWDFSELNIATWKKISPKYEVFHCKLGYSPILEKIPEARAQDFDATFIGRIDDYRYGIIKAAFESTAHTYIGLNTFSNLWGQTRDEVVARSKLMLNISLPDTSFETVRVSYYLNNRKPVLAVIDPKTHIDQSFRNLVLTCAKDEFRQHLDLLITNDSFRRGYAQYAYSEFKKLDFRENVYQFFKPKIFQGAA